MPQYVLNRDFILRNTYGVISFSKGEPAFVPPIMEREAVMIGAEKVDGNTPSLVPEEKSEVEVPFGDERESQILVAFELIVERNDPADFTGQGAPTVKAVGKVVGFDVERGEVQSVWQKWKLAKSEVK